ncbi:PleD family two-component system response regulator [Pedobacter psychrodurus]|jgi:DNA-binding response OmpR family regulator|uniref:response regulator n=1 Tax=Pedobacter psychrodurus TaxID=2530456 RepID=UPI00292EB647|nr:response regulator [Pedobacter psychrodurus]
MAKKIYVLEDDKDIREIIEMILEEEKYEVVSFSSVNEFMAKDKHEQADLFLLDIRLPDGNGISVCEMLKKNYSTEKIPVLMMSAHSSKKEVENSCSAQGFIGKPFDIDNLIDQVGQSIRHN